MNCTALMKYGLPAPASATKRKFALASVRGRSESLHPRPQRCADVVGFSGLLLLVQRVFKCDDIQNTGVTRDKELNILIHGTSFCVIK